VNAASEWRLARISEIFFRAPVFRQIGRGVEAANRDARNRRETGVAMLVKVGAGGSANGILRSFFQSRKQGFFCPVFFARRGMTPLKHLGDRVFCDLRLGGLFVGHGAYIPVAIIEEEDAGGKVRTY